MKYYFFILLVFSTYLITHGTHGNMNISFHGSSFPNVPILLVKIIVLFLIPLFTYWTINEIKLKLIPTYCKNSFYNCIKKYMENKKANKVENLLLQYPNQINDNKDIYYLDGKLILKTSNITENGALKYPGYTKTIGRIEYCIVYLSVYTKVLCDINVFLYIFLTVSGFILFLTLLYQVSF